MLFSFRVVLLELIYTTVCIRNSFVCITVWYSIMYEPQCVYSFCIQLQTQVSNFCKLWKKLLTTILGESSYRHALIFLWYTQGWKRWILVDCWLIVHWILVDVLIVHSPQQCRAPYFATQAHLAPTLFLILIRLVGVKSFKLYFSIFSKLAKNNICMRIKFEGNIAWRHGEGGI